ncbi:hypothetical protein TUBRATIS_16580 [Tubulinosema ratisbonensis]|uniref:Uncharacterized protein n=1 Tax=Tubulinosema ratisbonensis TaxID=291195 RepID=A0A437AKZ4_9MICR|nr:hypothetical protein TUBRATIS_16580 [Tubulinosema ratisbonensis]
MSTLLLFLFKQILSTQEEPLNLCLKDQNKINLNNLPNIYNQAVDLIDTKIDSLDDKIYDIIMSHDFGKETNDKIKMQLEYFKNILNSFKDEVGEIYKNNKNISVLEALCKIEITWRVYNDEPVLSKESVDKYYKSIYMNIIEELRKFFISQE